MYEKVIQDDDLHDIPLLHIMAVLIAVVEAIGSGECFYMTEED